MADGELWHRIQEVLKKSVNQRQYSIWLEAACLESIQESTNGKLLRIGVPGPLHRDWILTNFLGDLRQAVSTQIPDSFEIDLVINTSLSPSAGPYDPAKASMPETVTLIAEENREATGRRDILNPEYTFSTFVVGQGNQFAHAACHSISERPGKHVNPLFVCGPSGTGKTHLLNAVGNSIKDKFPQLRICYVSGERFLNDVVTGIRHNQMDRFRQRYREKYDVLIVDDIHVIARTQSTQEEFFYTFNSFHEARKQVVIASDKLPREMTGLEDRIRSRLEWGLTVDIQPPDMETRMAILRYKAERSHLFLPDDVVNLIAQISKKSVRELEGNLATIRMYAELRSVPITLELAKEVFSVTLRQQKGGFTIEDLIKTVAASFHVTARDLKGDSRIKTFVRPRQIAMYLSRKVLDLGYAEIGRAFGNRDHTTVLHSEAKVRSLLLEDPETKSAIDRLEAEINNSQWTLV